MAFTRSSYVLLTALLLAVFPFYSALGEEPAPAIVSPPTDLSLKGTFELALKNSSRLAIGKERVLQKETSVTENRSAFLPRITLGVTDMDATRNLKAQGVSFPGAPDKVGPFSTFDGRLTLNETLLNLAQQGRVNSAREDSKSATLELDLAGNDVLYQSALLYYNALRTEAAVEAEKANMDLSEELLTFSQHQKEAGLTTLLDVTRARVKLAQDRQKWISAVSERDNAILALQKQIGLPQGYPVRLVNDEVPATDFPPLNESIKIALGKRKEITLQIQREKVREMQYRAVSGEKYPTIQLFSDYGEIGNGVNDAFPTYTVGVTLNLPLYDGRNLHAREEGLASEIAQEQIRKKDTSLQVELEVRQIFNDLISAKKQLETAEERVALAEKELKLTEHRFETGVGNHIELLTTQTSVTEAREGLVESRYINQATRLKYFYVTGQMEALFLRMH